MKEKLVLIGNGMAGVRCIEEVLKADPNKFEITIFGGEPHPNYNRIMLSSVLQGDTTVDDIILNDYAWYEKNNITLHVGDPIVKVDTEQQIVYSSNGLECKYDKLIFATGSDPFMLPLPGADKKGVIAFRDIKDCETMMEYSKKYKKAVVIGGGLLGLEAARGLLNLDMDVKVVHIFDYLMERQLDEPAARMLQKELEAQGMKFLMNKHTEKILGRDRVEGLRFKDGTTVDADLLVMAVGIRPNVALAKEAGLEINRAIVVNDYMETNIKNVYAVGECAEHRGIAYGLVAPLYEQGKALAHYICTEEKQESRSYKGSLIYTQLKVSGVDVFSAGDFKDTEETKAIRVHDEFEGVYKKVVVKDNKVIGAVLFGNTADSPRLLDLMKKQVDISEMNKVSILPTEDKADSESPVISMDANEIVCGCNGVSKGAIVRAISENGLTSVEEVKKCTNAARSCGGCKPLVADLLEHTLGDGFSGANQKEAMCGCTDLTHEEVVAEIREKGLSHTKEVMNVLGWTSDEGCSKCRPALNYYLGMVNPLDYEDEQESRFVNERLHANINHDGTHTVVPRMYGGVTNPKQLRKIADVAEKYNVPLVKVTGGQRIDLFGVKREDLPSVWEDLDMPSGYAYGKALRTVKTCVGKDFCRFGTQDSIGLGVKLEEKFQGLQGPHKIKMAVSACPRNCAESGIKDVGIVGLEGAYELYVGGNGGVDLRAGDLFCRAETDEEVIDIVSAYLQYYRETGRYLERTSHWIERVGLDHVKSVVIDDLEKRKELIERMDIALSTYKDPWKEIINDKEKRKVLFENIEVGSK